MRLRSYAAIGTALMLCGCASTPDTEVLASTPASLEIAAWCSTSLDSACRQHVADMSQARCKISGKNAQYVRSTLIQRDLVRGERWDFVYNCI